MSIVELRQYRMHPGQRDNWVRFMNEVIVPFQKSKGMQVLGMWVAEEDPDLFVWMREFESEAERERLYEEVYQSDFWKTEVAPNAVTMNNREKMVITRLIPTTAAPVGETTGALLELRQYRTQAGKRDDWVRLFHELVVPFQTSKGIRILGSWVGEEEDDLFVWIREFDSEEARVGQYAEVYESDYWKNEALPKIREVLQSGKAVITRMNPARVGATAST
jgi:quinol monooxygenase YgiN